MAAHQSLAVTEQAFQATVLELARLTGWRCYHTWASLRSPAGFPDLVMVRGERLVFAELKSARGKLSEAQSGWLEALRSTGAEVYLWRPEDWSAIEDTLRR